MSGKELQSALAKLTNTMFHELPSILYPMLAVNVSISHGINSYVGVKHKSLDEIIQELREQDHNIHY